MPMSRWAVGLLTLAALPDGVAESPVSVAWRAEEGLVGAAVRVPSEGDGTVEVVDLAGRKAVRNTGASPYVYFDLPEGFAPAKAWVTVEFLDDGLGHVVLEYDAKQEPGAPLMASYRQADAAHGTLRLGTGAWRRALFELAQPGLRNRENYHSDFRLSPRVSVTSIRVSGAPPPDAELADIRSAGDLGRRPPLVTVGAGVESTIGGQDQFDVTKTAAWKEQLLRELPVQKLLGATSHETYVVWAACQATRDAWDFAHYDACVEAHRQAGLKWVPFVILGPAYTLPDWYYKSDERSGYRCLEHGQESDIQSLWAPKLAGRVETFLAQFANRYRDRGAIESVLLGITGNYGEAIYPATGNDWTADRHGKYHTHPGMWCGDPQAIADFQGWLRVKYGHLERLNAAWKADLKGWDAARPVKDEKSGAARAWLDTVDWYRDSMNRWIGLWMGVTTREMPGVPVYLCTGGHAPPEHGSEFGIQSKLAARHKGGVRITNEASDYPANFTVTRWVASACRFYGTFFGFEPAGGVDEKGIVARIYNATASGAKQLHHYSDNLANPKAVEKWKQYGRLLRLRDPKIDVALWYPNRMVDLRRGDVWRLLREMREVCDYDIVDDCMIRDGALDRYRILVCVSGGPYEADVLRRVGDWIRPDRALFLPEGHAVVPVEGDGQAAAGWKGSKGVQVLPAGAGLDAYWPALRETLASMGILVTGARGVYGTIFRDGSALLLNMTDAPGQVTVKGNAVAVPPAAIVEVP
jgi:hypothetical protein